MAKLFWVGIPVCRLGRDFLLHISGLNKKENPDNPDMGRVVSGL